MEGMGGCAWFVKKGRVWISFLCGGNQPKLSLSGPSVQLPATKGIISLRLDLKQIPPPFLAQRINHLELDSYASLRP